MIFIKQHQSSLEFSNRKSDNTIIYKQNRNVKITFKEFLVLKISTTFMSK